MVESVNKGTFSRSSHPKVLCEKCAEFFGKNSEKNACTGDLQKLCEAGLPVYLKRDSCIRVFQLFFKNSSEQFFLIEYL